MQPLSAHAQDNLLDTPGYYIEEENLPGIIM